MTDREVLNLILSELQGVKGETQGLKDEMQGLQGETQGLKDEMQGLKDEMQGLKDEMQGVKTELSRLNHRVTGIELHLENVTDKNIQTIAEGHLDLSRKLDEALKVENEKEMLLIRVRILEDEMRKIKEKPDQIA